MAYTAEQLQSLIDLRASGRLSVTAPDGRKVQFQTGADLDKAIAQAKRDIAAADAATADTKLYKRRYMEYGRG